MATAIAYTMSVLQDHGFSRDELIRLGRLLSSDRPSSTWTTAMQHAQGLFWDAVSEVVRRDHDEASRLHTALAQVDETGVFDGVRAGIQLMADNAPAVTTERLATALLALTTTGVQRNAGGA